MRRISCLYGLKKRYVKSQMHTYISVKPKRCLVMLKQVESQAYLEMITSRNEGNFVWRIVENFTHSEILSVVVVRAVIILTTMPGTLRSRNCTGNGTFAAWIQLIERNDHRWFVDSTGNCPVGKTSSLEYFT